MTCRRPISISAFFFLSLTLHNAWAMKLPDFTGLVKENSAAVVNISTSGKNAVARGIPPGFNIPDIPGNQRFHEFLKKFFGETPNEQRPQQEQLSLGSGFIISDDGYLITNHHVIRNSDKVIVRLNDRREYAAEIIGSDERSDIAVLKIEASNLPVLKLGNSDDVKVGEWVLAIGSPFGFDHSVTAGIVSAIGRSLPNENYVPFIQTDVAINPGNSGGPLFNLDGEVIGVNSQIYSRTGGFMGLSFAVPVDVVENVYKQLRKQGHVSRGWLGVLIQDVTKDLAESFNMEHPHGALITKVLDDGPAKKAGIEVGDIIVKYDNKNISFSSDLPPLVGSTTIGAAVPIDVIRRGKPVTIRVKISELHAADESLASNKNRAGGRVNKLNITVQNLDNKQREELDIDDHGVMIEEVGPGPAQTAGIRRGDVLLLLNNIKIKNASHFESLIKTLPNGKSVPVLIQRSGGPIFLALKIDE